MAAKGKAIIFYRCNLFILYFVSIDERPTMGSQPNWPNLSSRSEVVSIYKCPNNISGASPPQIWGAKKYQILDHFFRDFSTQHCMSP